jgi:hypothetical protein
MRVKVAVLMTIAGTLKTMALADIFQWVTVGEYTGTLVVSSGDISKSVYFKSGQIISCASNDPKEFLGHFLVSRGMISEADIPAAMEEQDRSGELLGRILVEQRAISQQDLDRMLSLKAEEAIYEIVRWPDGDFHFIDNVLPEHELVPVSVDANGLIFEGLRRRDEWTLIEKIIPDPACVPVSVADLLVDVEDEAARTVLSLVDDDRSVEDICLQTHSSEFFVCEILMREARQGRLKIVRPRFRGVVGDDTVISAETLVSQARGHLEEKRYEHALRRLRAARILEPDNRELANAIREAETEIRTFLEIDGVDVGGIPHLVSTLDELSSQELSPEEGFILSRINGDNDVASILQISPLSELDALLVFWKLLTDGHIRLEFP